MSAPSLTSRQNIDGIYIPVGLLIFGTLIVKKEWTPYATLLALALGAYKLYQQRRSPLYLSRVARPHPEAIRLTNLQSPRSSSSRTSSRTSSSRRRPSCPTTRPCQSPGANCAPNS